MLTQKLYRNGNSVVVSIPKEYLEDLKLKEGSEVILYRDEVEEKITITPKGQKEISSAITPKFLKWLESFNKEYGPALNALAKR